MISAHPLQRMMPLPAYEAASGPAGTAVLLVERQTEGYDETETRSVSTFLAQRSFDADGFGGYLCCPGGKPHDGEDLFVAAQRETEEETGLAISLGRFSWVGVIVIWKAGKPVPVWLFLVELREGEIPKTPDGEESTLLGPWERYDLADDLTVTEALTPGTVALVEIAKTLYEVDR
jgi:8-oxo-dGTP pyrophosphatase MutT (NUDIX family)